MGGMDDKQKGADAFYLLGSISIIASLLLALVWILTEWAAVGNATARSLLLIAASRRHS